MDGNQRRKQIIEILKNTTEPISGTTLAKQFHVSRQVIVQDIALLKANHFDILSTNKGYLLFVPQKKWVERVYYVNHDNDQIEDELNTIVDLGGRVLNVMVDHEIYGKVTAPLIINNRKDVLDFIKKIEMTSAIPLKHLGNGNHYHTIEADKEETLDLIESELLKKGYLK